MKRGDKIKKVNGNRVSSKKNLLSLLKKSRTNRQNKLQLLRGKKKISIYYRLSKKNSSRKKYYKVVKVKTHKPAKDKSRFIDLSKKERLFYSKKRKTYQRAHTIQINSFVYKRPDFDSKKIGVIDNGSKMLVTRKVYLGPNQFGSFYKIFYHKKNRKLRGYISEVDVVSEFDKKGKKNPNFKKVDDVLLAHRTVPEKSLPPKVIKLPSASSLYSLGPLMLFKQRITKDKQKSLMGGIKLGYNPQQSALVIDANIFGNLMGVNTSLLGFYRVIHRPLYSLSIGSGVMLTASTPVEFAKVDYCFIPVSLAVEKQLLKNWVLRLEASVFYKQDTKQDAIQDSIQDFSLAFSAQYRM